MKKTISILMLLSLSIVSVFSANITYVSDIGSIYDDYYELSFSDIRVRMYPNTKTIKIKGNYSRIEDGSTFALKDNSTSKILAVSTLTKADRDGWYAYQGDYDEFKRIASHNYFYPAYNVDYVFSKNNKQIAGRLQNNCFESEYEFMRRAEIKSYKDVYGDIGPSGGYIILDKGFYSNGWRYIEVAPNDLRTVEGKYTVDANDPLYSVATPVTTLPKTITYTSGGFPRIETVRFKSTYVHLGEAKKNTYSYEYSDVMEPIDGCRKLEYNGYTDWLLPTKEEMYLMKNNLQDRGKGNFTDVFTNVRPIRYY